MDIFGCEHFVTVVLSWQLKCRLDNGTANADTPKSQIPLSNWNMNEKRVWRILQTNNESKITGLGGQTDGDSLQISPAVLY
jgi:hypothetical protein